MEWFFNILSSRIWAIFWQNLLFFKFFWKFLFLGFFNLKGQRISSSDPGAIFPAPLLEAKASLTKLWLATDKANRSRSFESNSPDVSLLCFFCSTVS